MKSKKNKQNIIIAVIGVVAALNLLGLIAVYSLIQQETVSNVNIHDTHAKMIFKLEEKVKKLESQAAN